MLYQAKLQDVRSFTLFGCSPFFVYLKTNSFFTPRLFSCAVTTASSAVFNLENIIAIFAIFGWQMTKNRITVMTVAFAGSEEPKIFNIVMTAECASTRAFIPITTVKVANTSRIVLFAKNSCSVLGVHHTKCRVDMRYIGNVFDSWRHMTRDAQFAKRQPKRENE